MGCRIEIDAGFDDRCGWAQPIVGRGRTWKQNYGVSPEPTGAMSAIHLNGNFRVKQNVMFGDLVEFDPG